MHKEIASYLKPNAAFLEAAKDGNLKDMEYWATDGRLQKGVDIDVTTEDSGTSALYYAAAKGHVECVEELLRLNAETSGGELTPLMIARVNEHQRCIDLIMGYEARIAASSVQDVGQFRASVGSREDSEGSHLTLGKKSL